MKTYSIETLEMFKCRYIVDANSAEEAKQKFENGEADEAAPKEFDSFMALSYPVEIDDDEDSD